MLRLLLRAGGIVLLCGFCLVLPPLLLSNLSSGQSSGESVASSWEETPPPDNSLSNSYTMTELASPLPYRAVWISYLEWQHTDFSSSQAFEEDISQMLEQCADAGLTVVIAQVRPFGDALYPSELFPYSHLCTGTQGQDPGFDPLAILVEQAHLHGLELEAWVNPYRLQNSGIPASLSDTSLAVSHPDWVKQVDGGLWLDPSREEVQAYIAEGVRELCDNYAIDGIHFDDYFYPTTDASFDSAEYESYCAGGGLLSLDDWRRENVSSLVARCYEVAHDCGVRFGISPQGNLQNNLTAQYSDVTRWLSEPGFADYLMPQIYWGLDWQSGNDTASAFDCCLAEWLALPRAEGVALYAGLGAYRIGDGDGSASSMEEWNSGHALTEQVNCLLQEGIPGFALYRYDSLFENNDWPSLAKQEVDTLKDLIQDFAE